MPGLVQGPTTPAAIAAAVNDLGLMPGSSCLVHTSMSKLGFVVGGAQGVVQGLLQALGPMGTLVVPTHSTDRTNPAGWCNPPVPEAWWSTIRDGMPAFDPLTTPSMMMGVVPELARTWPGAIRSGHPHHSFAAIGPKASELMTTPALDESMGEGSPLAMLAAAKGKILLLGCGFGSCSMLHLAEVRAGVAPHTKQALQGASLIKDGRPSWVSFAERMYDEDDFINLGVDALAAGVGRQGRLSQGRLTLLDAQALLDFAIPWLKANRPHKT